MVRCVLLIVLTLSHVLLSVESNPEVPEPQVQVPGSLEDRIDACLDSVSLDQQLVKTMVISLQNQVTQLQGQLLRNGPAVSNIVQCSWNGGSNELNGLIKTCAFRKKTVESILKLEYQGNLMLAIIENSSVCRRWFFAINGQECEQPAALDIQIYERDEENRVYRPTQMGGLCRNIPPGDLQVTFNIGECLTPGYPTGRASTGWETTSRIVIQELDVEEPERIQ